MHSKKHIVIGLSGGVDSSVAAWLLKSQGHKVLGIFMKNWDDEDTDTYCTSKQDFLDAATVADVLGIEFDAVSFSKEYREKVFKDFLHEYSVGRTPNPDVFCNSEIKFKSFLKYSHDLGAKYIATGHYSRTRVGKEGNYELLKGCDESKDQSYFLHRLSQAQLSSSIFPLGELKKNQVRELAKEIGLPNAEKKDSTGICFIGERPFKEFLAKYLKTNPGPICNLDGDTLGRHDGLAFYTIGQRKGIGIGGLSKNLIKKENSQSPWFVVAKDNSSNTLLVAQGHDNPHLFSSSLKAINSSWVSGAPPNLCKIQAKIRYRQKTFSTSLACSGVEFSLRFKNPQWAVTPGQSAVLYNGEKCLGGGIIS
jgi:tRNA-specific 2-thiouridylase